MLIKMRSLKDKINEARVKELEEVEVPAEEAEDTIEEDTKIKKVEVKKKNKKNE